MLDPTPINLFNAIFNFVVAPGAVLGPFFKAPSGNRSDSLDSNINAALNKVLRGQERKAFKLLHSHGVAKIDDATVLALQKLHPERKGELVLPQSECPQLTVDPFFVAKKLFLESADHNVSKDVYGWAPWMFHACRGEKQGFFASLVSFTCFLANNPKQFPSTCAFLLSGGALTPLHKAGAEERKRREQTSLLPKLRPINSGSLLTKTVLASVLASPAGQRAAERVAPFQLSLGTSRGVEKLIHVCRAAYENRWLVGKNDYENGFNSVSRQKMLDAHSLMFPESTDIFNFFYGVNSPVYLIDDEMQITVIQSEEGARQGCTAGTEGFCFTIHPMLTGLQARYPEFDFRVLTDDVVPLVPPPASDSFDDWQALYLRYANCLKDLEELSELHAGLRLNPQKGALLLPTGAPLPALEVRAKFPVGFEFRQDGMRIAGSPVGTDAFMHEFLNDKVTETRAKLAAIKLVGRKSPRAAHRLLTACASKLMCFLAATVPPNVSLCAFAMFDQYIEDCFFDILTPTNTICSRERFERATLKASLPPPFGCGLFKVTDQARIAWWASVSASLEDPLLFKLKSGLSRFAEPAYQELIKLHGGSDSKHWTEVKHLYPDSSVGLLNGTRYSPVNPRAPKLSKVALKTLSKLNVERFQKLTDISLLSGDNATLTASDVIQASVHSLSGNIFSESIKSGDSGFKSNNSYVNFCRFFLGLPPAITIGGAKPNPNFDYPVQRCLSEHGGGCPFLDVTADHASSKCPATSHWRNLKHRNICRALSCAAQEAGLSTRCEPDTFSLLLAQFPKADCRRVFPKNVSKAYKAGFEKLSQAADFIASVNCPLSLEEKQMLIQKKIDLLPFHDGDAAGLRIDLSLENPETGETKWVDATAVHTSCASYREKELKAVAKRKLSRTMGALRQCQDILIQDPSPTLIDREAQKVEKYSRLLMVAAKQHVEGKRISLPTFAPFAVSDFGELSPAATDLQDWIVEQYRRKLAQNPRRSDGCSTSDLVRQFRHKLKISVQLAIASGLGAMIQAAGQPWKGGLGPS
jgi:hypothetical protein